MKNTIILTIHNKEKTITKILCALINNTSKITSNIIIILDGCTDNTDYKIDEFIELDELKKCLIFLEGVKNKSII